MLRTRVTPGVRAPRRGACRPRAAVTLWTSDKRRADQRERSRHRLRRARPFGGSRVCLLDTDTKLCSACLPPECSRQSRLIVQICQNSAAPGSAATLWPHGKTRLCSTACCSQGASKGHVVHACACMRVACMLVPHKRFPVASGTPPQPALLCRPTAPHARRARFSARRSRAFLAGTTLRVSWHSCQRTTDLQAGHTRTPCRRPCALANTAR